MGSKTASLDSENEAVKNAVVESSVKTENPNMARNARMGLVRFLQLKPELSSGFKRVMRKFQQEVHTIAEWEQLLEQTLKRTVK